MGKSHDLAVLARKTDRLDVVADSSGALSHRNLIINGDMAVSQRGDTASNITTNGVKTVDRFNVEGGSYDAFDLSVSTGPSGFPRALKVSRNSAVAAASGSEYALVSQTIEAANLQHLKYGTADAQPITISFWVKTTASGTYALNLYANDTGSARTATKNYTVDAANTWEHKSVTFEGDPSGQINNDNGSGMWIQWFLRAGSNYTGTQSPTWSAHTAAQYADGHDVDFMSAANGSWELTGVQCEVGREATDFEHIPYSDQLRRCQRYYEIIGNYCGASTYGTVWSHPLNTFSNCWTPIQYAVQKRASPTVSLINNGAWSGSTPNIYNTSRDAVVFNAAGYFYLYASSGTDDMLAADAEL